MICVGGKVKKMDLSSSTKEKENEPTPCICARKRTPPQDSGWLTIYSKEKATEVRTAVCHVFYNRTGTSNNNNYN